MEIIKTEWYKKYKLKQLEEAEGKNTLLKINDNGEVMQEIYFKNQQMTQRKINNKKETQTQTQTLMNEEVSEAYEKIKERENEERARRRAKTEVKDYALANDDLTLFITLTLDKKKIESRYDYEIIYKKLRNWLSNQVKRKGLKYIIIPELHKDGALHFHGIINEVLPLEKSESTTTNKQTIFNMPTWKYGFTTAVRINENRTRCINYITKYITKSNEKIGGRWYLHSQNLKKLEKVWINTDYDEVDAEEIEINGIKMKIKNKK